MLWSLMYGMAGNIISDRMDMHQKGNNEMGQSFEWNSGAGWMAVSSERSVTGTAD